MWLEGALNHPSLDVRLQAVNCITRRFDQNQPPALDWLVARLLERAHQDGEPRVRRAAIMALAHHKLAGMNLTDELIKCLHDESLAVRWAAEASLTQINQQRSTPPGLAASVSFGEPVPAAPPEVESETNLFDDFFGDFG